MVGAGRKVNIKGKYGIPFVCFFVFFLFFFCFLFFLNLSKIPLENDILS